MCDRFWKEGGGGFLAPPIHAATERHILNSVKNMHVGEFMKIILRKRECKWKMNQLGKYWSVLRKKCHLSILIYFAHFSPICVYLKFFWNNLIHESKKSKKSSMKHSEITKKNCWGCGRGGCKHSSNQVIRILMKLILHESTFTFKNFCALANH